MPKTNLNLFKFVEEWTPYVADAHKVANSMTPPLFREFKEGLKKERKGIYAGDDWCSRYGELMLPENLMKATMICEQFHVPLIICLQRMEQEGLLKGPKKEKK